MRPRFLNVGGQRHGVSLDEGGVLRVEIVLRELGAEGGVERRFLCLAVLRRENGRQNCQERQ